VIRRLDQRSEEAIIACLEQRLGAEDYMTFLMRCVDLRERGAIDSETLASLFFGNFAFRGADGVESVKEEFLAANYRSPQVRLFIERATPYLQETELWPGIKSLIQEILSGERNRWNWDRLTTTGPYCSMRQFGCDGSTVSRFYWIATAVAFALLKIRHRRKCSTAISVLV
jgi:hypothetical protein